VFNSDGWCVFDEVIMSGGVGGTQSVVVVVLSSSAQSD